MRCKVKFLIFKKKAPKKALALKGLKTPPQIRESVTLAILLVNEASDVRRDVNHEKVLNCLRIVIFNNAVILAFYILILFGKIIGDLI